MTESSQHIMLVDDNVSMSKVMARILVLKGFRVTIAGGGLEALEIAKKGTDIDIVFMDVKMPDLNGVETYKQLKNLLPDARVIMITAYAVDGLIQEALHEGAYGILYKPVDIDKLVSVIKKIENQNENVIILIIDDDDSINTTFSKILTQKGYEVVTASTGEQALKLAEEQAFDIIFIDMVLPGLDGLSTYNALRQIRSKFEAIVITGYAGEQEDRIEQMLLHSAYTCLQKPVDITAVFRIIDELVANKSLKVITSEVQ